MMHENPVRRIFMKKIISVLLMVAMLFCFSACSGASNDKSALYGKWNIEIYRDTDWSSLKATIEFTEDKMTMGIAGYEDTFDYTVTEDGKIVGTYTDEEGTHTAESFDRFEVNGDTLTLESVDGTYICKRA